MRKRLRIKNIALNLMVLFLVFLLGCGNNDGEFDLLTDFINTIWGYLIIGGVVLYFMFKHSGKNK